MKGVVHRDLKPSNVFLQALPDQADHVRLLDFGLAKFVDASSSRAPADLTRARITIGTPAYMAPEQVKGAPTDARTDVYAAGLLLFELLAGRRPFVADSPEGYLGAHLMAPIPSLAKLRPTLARASLFQAVVEQAMAKKPEERFEDAYAMTVALEDVVARLPDAVVSGGRPETRRKTLPRAPSAAPSGSRFWPRVMLVVTLAVGIAAVEEYLRREGAKQAKTTEVPAAQAP
jgi:serine/threonine protein kinase